MRAISLVGLLWICAACGPGADLVVGSKDFTEQVLLGELVAQQVERSLGATVDRRFNLTGTYICDQALRSGEIDLYVEYSGTALTTVLKSPRLQDSAEVLALLTREYAKEGLRWLPPLGFNNTFAILVRSDVANQLGLRRISDIRQAARRWRPGFGYEFKEREDGYHGFVQTYGLEFGAPAQFMALGLLYPALRDGAIDLAAGNSTDGLIEAMGLVVLEDDKRYFPPYDASIIVREDALSRLEGLEEALTALSGAISDEQMRRLNYRVDGKREPLTEVARTFLAELHNRKNE